MFLLDLRAVDFSSVETIMTKEVKFEEIVDDDDQSERRAWAGTSVSGQPALW